MNILYVVRPADGGMKNHILALLQNLDKTKYKITLASPERREWLPLLSGTGIDVVDLPLKGNLSLFSDLRCIYTILKLIKKKEIQLVHTHGMKAGLVGRMAGILTNQKRRPYLLSTVHNAVYQYPMSKYKKDLISRVEGILAQKTDKFIVVSEKLKQEIMFFEGAEEEQIKVIYNGIKIENFTYKTSTSQERMALGLNPFLPVIGTVARLAPQKGVLYFIKAASLMSQMIDEVQFLIVGDGPLRKELELEALKLGIKDKILFTGQLHDLGKIYPMIDVFVLPSLSEGLPLSIIEAMVAKCPIVATSVGGIPELIDHLETGILVPPANEHVIAQRILELLARPLWAEKLANAAAEKAQSHYSVEKMVQQTAEVYQKAQEAREAWLKGLVSENGKDSVKKRNKKGRAGAKTEAGAETIVGSDSDVDSEAEENSEGKAKSGKEGESESEKDRKKRYAHA